QAGSRLVGVGVDQFTLKRDKLLLQRASRLDNALLALLILASLRALFPPFYLLAHPPNLVDGTMYLVHLIADAPSEVELRPQILWRHREARVWQHCAALCDGGPADGQPRLILPRQRARRQLHQRAMRRLFGLLILRLLWFVVLQCGWRLVA